MAPTRGVIGVLLFLLFETSGFVGAQSLVFERRSVCELLGSPLRFSGHLVSVRAELIDGREMVLADPADASCGRLAWDDPDNPDVKTKPGFSLVRDQSYEQVERVRGRIVATFEGRFDWTPLGSGPTKLRDTRLVLHRVRDVAVTPAQ
jgi:hypothetical protein